MSFRSAIAANAAAYSVQTAGLHKLGLSAQSATGSTRTALQGIYATASALPATYLGRLQSTLGSAFAQLDTYAWRYVAPNIYWCDPSYGECTCQSDPFGDCGVDGGGGGDPALEVSADIEIDPGSRQVLGHVTALVYGFDPSLADGFVSIDSVQMDGATGIVAGTPAGEFEAEEEVVGEASQAGTYTINADASGSVYYSSGPPWSGQGHAASSAQYSGPACAGPVIGGIEIYPGGSNLPQPTNGLLVGTSGTLQVNAACLDASVQMTANATGVTLSNVALAPGGGAVTAAYSVDPNAPAQPGNLVLATNAGSASAVLEVVASVPYITSISPASWPAGQATTVTIAGAGFGGGPGSGSTQGTVTVTPANGSYPVTFAVAPGGWSDGAIVGTITTTSGDPGQTVSVSVTGGSYGMGFQSNPGNQRPSPNATATVTGAGQPILNLTLNGAAVAPKSTQYISGTPAYPPLVASLTGPQGQVLTGNVQWTFVAKYTSPTWQGIWVDYMCTSPGSGAVNLPASSSWNIASQLSTGLCGGVVTISYVYGNYNGAITLNVLGMNPSVPTIQAALNAYPWTNGVPWYLFQLVNHESTYLQFIAGGAQKNSPKFGPPQGFGVMQVENPNYYQIWDWTQNLAAGAGILQGDITSANNSWSTQLFNWGRYNNGVYNNGIPPSTPLPPPPNSTEGTCVFSYPETSTSKPFSDAVAMKYYNAGQAVPYIKFVPPTSPTKYDAIWFINPLGGNGTDYPALVCNTKPQ